LPRLQTETADPKSCQTSRFAVTGRFPFSQGKR